MIDDATAMARSPSTANFTKMNIEEDNSFAEWVSSAFSLFGSTARAGSNVLSNLSGSVKELLTPSPLSPAQQKRGRSEDSCVPYAADAVQQYELPTSCLRRPESPGKAMKLEDGRTQHQAVDLTDVRSIACAKTSIDLDAPCFEDDVPATPSVLEVLAAGKVR